MKETETNVGEPVMELTLCESERVVLRPDVLYRFYVVPGCAQCVRIQRAGRIPDVKNREPREGTEIA